MTDTRSQTDPQEDPLALAVENLNRQDRGEDPSPITATARPQGSQAGGATPVDDTGGWGSALRGVADTVSFGFGDEVGGFIAALGAPVNDSQARQTIFNSNESFSAIVSSNIARERQILAEDRRDHFKASLAGGLAGGLLIPFGAGARGALQVAKVGAVGGAAYGLGSGEGVTGRLESAAVGGVVGGAIGGVLGKAVEAGGSLVNRLRGRTPETHIPTPGATETGGAQAADAAATVTGPDGTAYATRLDDGSELRGFAHDGTPQYGEAPTAHPEGVAPPAAEPEVPLTAPAPDPANPGAFHEQPIGSIGVPELNALQEEVTDLGRRMAAGGPDHLRAADITRPSEAASRVGEFRLGNLGSDAEIPAVLGAVARRLTPTAPKTDEQLYQQSAALFEPLRLDPEAALAWARQAAGGVEHVDNTLMVLRSVWTQSARDVDGLSLLRTDWTQAGDEVLQHALEKIYQVSALGQQVGIAKAAIGRAQRVNSLPDVESYLKSVLSRTAESEPLPPVPPRELPPLPRDRQEVADWFELYNTMGGIPGLADAVNGRLAIPTPGKYLRTSVANFFTASILSAPKTIALNLIGPSFISLVRNAERFGGAAAGALNPFASAEERAAMRAVARETPIAYLRTLGDITDAFRFGLRAGEVNRSILGGGSSSTDALATYGPLTPNLLSNQGADPSWMYSLGNLINAFPKAFARVNNGLDETAKRLSYMGEVRVRAQVEAAQQGLSGDGFQQFVRNRLQSSVDEVGHAQDEQLLRSAERTTFTSQVGEEGGWVRRFANGVQGLRRDIPETRFIVPVFNVPANALGETFRRIPLANRLMGTHAADLAGENGVVAQAEAHGRTLLGASFLTAGVMMNRMGILTGAGPQEATDRRVWLQTHQPYSIRVGDEWVRYDKYDILGGLLSIPATITDASTYRAADKGIEDMMLSGAGALAQWFKDRAALRTAASLLNAGSDPTADFGTMIHQFADSTAAGFIPAFVRTLGVDTTDPYVRMRRDWTDYLKASIPGLSQTLEPTRNVLGEPIQRSADTFGEALFPVTMQSAVTYQSDPVMDELDRIYQVTGYGAGADPKSLGYGHFNPKDVKLEDGRSIYDRAMQLRQTIQLDGRTLRQSLQDTIDSAAYNNGVDADSSQRVTSLGDASRGYLIRQVFDRFNKAAKAQLANESPTADRYLTAAAAKERDDAYLRDLSVEDLVRTPRLYQDRGINSGAYSEKIRGGTAGVDPLTAALGLQ